MSLLCMYDNCGVKVVISKHMLSIDMSADGEL